MHRKSLAMAALVALAACNSSDPSGTAADTPVPSTIIPVASYLEIVEVGDTFSENLDWGEKTPAPVINPYITGTDIGYGASAGFNTNGSVRAVAALMPSTDLVDPPTDGSASFNGLYTVIEVKDIEVRPDSTSTLTPKMSSGAAVLDIDFAKGTLTGYSDGSPLLKIKGTFTGKDLEGTAVYDTFENKKIVGEMKGFVGATRAVGAMHGVSREKDRAFSGGFIAAAPEE